MAKAPTRVTNPDGSVTTTTYDAQGNIYEVSTVAYGSDGGKTETRQFASGETILLKYAPDGTFLGTLSQGADGLLSVSDPKTGTRTTYSADGTTPISRTTYNTDGSQKTDYLDPSGAVTRSASSTADQVNNSVYESEHQQEIATNTGKGSGNLFFNPGAVVNKDNAKAVKEFSEKFNLAGTPGFNQGVANDDLFGGPNAGKILFTNDAVGSTFAKIAG